ncbi:hypothetical protein ABPG75_005302 [Micractinium tetrahymenae]
MGDIKTAEGLGGVNVSPDDPRVRSEPPQGNQPRPSDPEWVDRKNPDELPKYMPGVGEGVAFDPASMTVVSAGGGEAEGQGGSASTTGMLHPGHQMGDRGSAEARGVRGTDTQAGSGGPTRIPDRAEAGKDYLSTAADVGKSAGERVRAGRDQDPASAPEGAPGTQGRTNWQQS